MTMESVPKGLRTKKPVRAAPAVQSTNACPGVATYPDGGRLRDQVVLALLAAELELRAECRWRLLVYEKIAPLYRAPPTANARDDKRKHARSVRVLLNRAILPAMISVWRTSPYMTPEERDVVDETSAHYTGCSLGRRLQAIGEAAGERRYEDTFAKRAERYLDAMEAFALVDVDRSRTNCHPAAGTAALHKFIIAYCTGCAEDWADALAADGDPDGPQTPDKAQLARRKVSHAEAGKA